MPKHSVRIRRLALAWLLASCWAGTAAQPADQFVLYLVGDAGGVGTDGRNAVVTALQPRLQAQTAPSALVYLGDNVYPRGFVPEHAADAQRILDAQLAAAEGFRGRTFFIPGNHDWQRGGADGWTAVLRQQAYLDGRLGEGALLPGGGCPGPVAVELDATHVLIAIDTQWFLHRRDKPSPDDPAGCDAVTDEAFFLQLTALLQQYRDRQVVVVGHHPLHPTGTHGGFYPLRLHLFPLNELNRKLYVPLPLLGSVYPLYRGLVGHPQDAPHPRYRWLVRNLTATLRQHPHVVYAAGHEHLLQLAQRDSLWSLISGSAYHRTPGRHRTWQHALFSEHGWVELHFGRDGSATAHMWVLPDDGKPAYEAHRELLWLAPTPAAQAAQAYRYTGPDSVRAPASVDYQAQQGSRFWLGENYRRVWATPITAPVFRPDTIGGGLRIVKLGGGQQTRSLRLQDSLGREYSLRSIDKYTRAVVPEGLRDTWAANIVQDQISASFPYGYPVVDFLAQRVGVLQNPATIVYVPPDSALGSFAPLFGGRLALLEQRLEPTAPRAAHLHKPTKIISTDKLLKRLHKNAEYGVDQQAVLRARLFDLVIADWDRHDDQWRWIGETRGKRTVYLPIARDRDQAFFVNEGVVPWLASRKWALPKLEGFAETQPWAPGLSYNARFFDRSFLNEPDAAAWQAQARQVQAALSDAVIDSAVALLDANLAPKVRTELARLLRERRDQLPRMAGELYAFLSQAVSVPGTNDRDVFLVDRLPDNRTHLAVYDRKRDGSLGTRLYERTFHPEETKEIRLFGQEGADSIVVRGQSARAIRLRVIGGTGSDVLIDSSHVGGWGRRTYAYDRRWDPASVLGPEVRDRSHRRDTLIHTYDRREFRYNRLAFLPAAQFNPDDKLFIGGGPLFIGHGFRKQPFAVRQQAAVVYAPVSGNYGIRYAGTFTDVFGRLSLQLDAFLNRPGNQINFFGLGNETRLRVPGRESEEAFQPYFRTRLVRFDAGARLLRRFGQHQTLTFGPVYEQVDVDTTPGRILADLAAQGRLPAATFRPQHYLGVLVNYELDRRDHPLFTREGVRLDLSLRWMAGINAISPDYGQANGSFSFYLPLNRALVFAQRVGAGTTWGRDVPFFHQQYLAGNTNLRGYRQSRFGGQTAAYSNTELRVRAFQIRSYYLPAAGGFQVFADVGRVWQPGERSRRWHPSVGGGVWLAPFQTLLLSASVAVGDEEVLPWGGIGFYF